MRVIGGIVVLFGLAIVPTTLLNLPLLGVVLLARRRLHPLLIRCLLASGFVAAGAWRMWQREWFDVWRHGVPSIGYMLTAYAPSLLISAGAGWMVGWWIGGSPNPNNRSVRLLPH